MRTKLTNNVPECGKNDSNDSMGSLEDEWELGLEQDTDNVVPYTERRADGRSGELILSGDEDSSNGGNERGGVVVENMFRTAAALSFPGTESLPSDIDSLYVSEMRESAMSTSVAPRETSRSWRLSKSHVLPVLMATTTIMTLLSGFLAWDRHSWRTSALHLEEELHRLREDMKKKNQSGNWQKQCGEENSPLGNSSDFDWDDECRPPAHQKIVLADNCWLHAEAALTFGSCAGNVKEGAKAFWGAVSSVGGVVWRTLSEVHMKEVSYAEEFFNFTDGRPDTAGFTLRDIVDDTSSFASATVAAGEAVMTAVSEMSGFMDGYVSMVLNATRDAIEDGSFLLHLD